MRRPTVVLFDIDGTLVTCAGAGKRSVMAAFDQLHGRPDAVEGLSLGGRTDKAIMRLGLEAIGVESSEAAIDAIITAYLKILVVELAAGPGGRALPGVKEAVDACLAHAAIATGLGTGNVKEGARLKLESAGIYDRFAFGGFGCDDERRHCLLDIGARRGATILDRPLSDCRIVVVGDTPRDVEAAKAIKAECVGVATGHFDIAALEEAGADRVFASLESPGAVETITGG